MGWPSRLQSLRLVGWVAELGSLGGFPPFDNTHAFTHVPSMTSIPVTQARAKLYQLLDEAADSHEPIQITGKRSNAVLVSEGDWRSIQETLHLISIPGMRDSIRKGMAEPLGKSSTKPGW